MKRYFVFARLAFAGAILCGTLCASMAVAQGSGAVPGGSGGGSKSSVAVSRSAPLTMDSVIENLRAKWVAGGATMWALLFCSILVVACLLERGFRLRRNAFSPAGMAAKADELWKQGKYDEILKLCDTHPKSTLSKILRFIVENRKAPADALNDAIGEIAGRDLTLHYMLAYPVLAVATISPLLGLFGTVLGLIDSFETVAVAGYMGDPSLLAGGISKGLVCTAFGLLVAIPSLFSYHMLRLRTRYLNQILEKDASLVTRSWLWKNEGSKP